MSLGHRSHDTQRRSNGNNRAKADRRIDCIDRWNLFEIGNQVSQVMIAHRRVIVVHFDNHMTVRFDAVSNGSHPIGVGVGLPNAAFARSQVGNWYSSQDRIITEQLAAQILTVAFGAFPDNGDVPATSDGAESVGMLIVSTGTFGKVRVSLFQADRIQRHTRQERSRPIRPTEAQSRSISYFLHLNSVV